jgi:hypothetical protein
MKPDQRLVHGGYPISPIYVILDISSSQLL